MHDNHRRDQRTALMERQPMRVLGHAWVASGVVAWLITMSFGVQSAVGSMLFGIIPGLVLGLISDHRERVRGRSSSATGRRF